MGMHLGLVAVRAGVTDLKTGFLEGCPNFDVVDVAETFGTDEEFWTWMRSNAKFVSSADWKKENPGVETYALWQDGEWAVLYDPTYVFASDSQSLSALSQKLGRVLTFVVESAGGTAHFSGFEDGKCVREIAYNDGESMLQGQALPQESGINVEKYYMDETDTLLRAFGLRQTDAIPVLDSTIALAVVDHTDYSDLLQGEEAK